MSDGNAGRRRHPGRRHEDGQDRLRDAGPYVQLRPPGGGREWDADPDAIRQATDTDVLRARVTEMNRAERLTAISLSTAAKRSSRAASTEDRPSPMKTVAGRSDRLGLRDERSLTEHRVEPALFPESRYGLLNS